MTFLARVKYSAEAGVCSRKRAICSSVSLLSSLRSIAESAAVDVWAIGFNSPQSVYGLPAAYRCLCARIGATRDVVPNGVGEPGPYAGLYSTLASGGFERGPAQEEARGERGAGESGPAAT